MRRLLCIMMIILLVLCGSVDVLAVEEAEDEVPSEVIESVEQEDNADAPAEVEEVEQEEINETPEEVEEIEQEEEVPLPVEEDVVEDEAPSDIPVEEDILDSPVETVVEPDLLEEPEIDGFIELEGVSDGDVVTVIVPYANISSSYGVGTSNISIFGPIASKLSYGVHYVYYREGQYNYCLAYSSDLVYEDGVFSSETATVVTYNTYSGSSGQASFSVSTERNFTLSPGNYLVWSDLGDYPTLYERGGEDYAKTACIILASFGIYYLFERLWHSIRQRYLDVGRSGY